MSEEVDTSVRLNGAERIATFGGEAYVGDGIEFADYGIDFENHSVYGLTPAQAIQLATSLVDHLMLCGHKFNIIETGEQDQRERLICVDKNEST